MLQCTAWAVGSHSSSPTAREFPKSELMNPGPRADGPLCIENGAESKQQYSCLVSAYSLLYKNEFQNALELKNVIDVKVKIVIDLQNVIEL